MLLGIAAGPVGLLAADTTEMVAAAAGAIAVATDAVRDCHRGCSENHRNVGRDQNIYIRIEGWKRASANPHIQL
eukprot:COSAG02_NODE_12059_length_1605_cov_1.968792_1_plen_74_part_00